MSGLANDINHNDGNNIQGGSEGERYHLTLAQLNKVNNSQEQLISGSNIKTINGNSILGNGDLLIGEYPQYKVTFMRDDIIWTDDYITIPHSTYLRDKKIEIHKALLRKGSGDIVLNPRVSYPRSEAYNSTPPNEFYLKDGDGYITKGNDFEYLHIEYSILSSTELYNYDVRNQIGENVIQDENSGQTYHSRAMRKVFLACYPKLWSEYGIQAFESIKDPLTGNSLVSRAFEPKYMELKQANLLFRPYGDGARAEQVGSNPNILKVGSHYGNWGQFGAQQERNITSADDVFLTNVVAVAARVDDEITTEFQTTYGRGVEFFEDITKLDVEFPDKTYLRDVSYGTVDETGLIYTATQPTFPDWVSKRKLQVGEKIYFDLTTAEHDDPTTAQQAVVAEIINDYTVRLETPVTPGSSRVAYIYCDLTALGGQQQSPTCSIVGAKLKKIKLLSGANWQIVREAARMTAKKTIDGVFDNYPGHWDKFRGFGKIQPDDAVQYIKDNYTENDDYLNSLADDMDRARGINPLLPYDSISDNTPVPRRLMHKVTENNYTDEDKAKLDAYPELTGIASDGFVNAAGEIQQIAAAVGGFANNLYFSNADSDVAGYKTLTYDLPVAETAISQAVSSGDGEVLVESHLYPDPISADIFPAGLWSFEFYGRVSSTVGTTQIGVRYFRYTSTNEKVYLFPAIVWSNAITNTVNNWIPILVQQPSFSVQTGDRMGCDIFVKSTSMAARTVYYILGDGYASYLNNPNAVRHRILRAKNEELRYQHLDTTQTKTTLEDTDSLGL